MTFLTASPMIASIRRSSVERPSPDAPSSASISSILPRHAAGRYVMSHTRGVTSCSPVTIARRSAADTSASRSAIDARTDTPDAWLMWGLRRASAIVSSRISCITLGTRTRGDFDASPFTRSTNAFSRVMRIASFVSLG
jgi:hypothetical protein